MEIFTILISILLVFLVSLFIVIKKLSNWGNPEVQALKRWYVPVLGHMPYFMTLPENHLPSMEEHAKDHKTYQLYLPINKSIIITVEPEIVKHFLSTKFETVYNKGLKVCEQYRDFFGSGIFNSNFEDWKQQRSFASSLFHVQYLKQYIEIFHNNSVKLFDQFESFKNSQTPINIQDYFMRYTLDSFAEIGFGVDLDSINQGDVNSFSLAFDYVQTFTERRGRYGDLWKLKEKFFKDQKYIDSLKYLDDYIYAIINERRKEDESIISKRKDLLSKILCDKSLNKTDKELRDFVLNYLIAGRDTTAILLTFCFYLLADNEEVEQKVIDEINEVVGSGDDMITWEQQSSLNYTQFVLKEVLRLYPPVPIDGYTAFEEDVLPGGQHIKKNTEIYYPSWVIHRREDLYPKALEFIPERWSEEAEKKCPPHPYAYIPFHGGPRICLGQQLAYVEAKTMISNLLRKYKLRRNKDHEIDLKQAIILTSQNGVYMDIYDA
eukprot:TRINITY_DN2043_c0_g2_i1.p1 TRINITY_DN2043_c0_g2~~TRINITY_DN2043_c0_g2_i1.p1  ORF type:complete len:525 (+),score=158.72 TRINITY_DN2043_c0_g2_i1:100-1575(+)